MSDDRPILEQRHTDAIRAAEKRKYISEQTFSPRTLCQLAEWGYLQKIASRSRYQRYVSTWKKAGRP